jgi:hypothetical protein
MNDEECYDSMQIILFSTPGLPTDMQVITLNFITLSSLFHQPFTTIAPYSQTLENKSSLPELNAAGFAEAAPPVEVEACGALLQPPKSSSTVTCGLVTFGVAPNPPEVAPQPLLEAAGIVTAAGAAGFESLQASLDDPHTSLLLKLANDEFCV